MRSRTVLPTAGIGLALVATLVTATSGTATPKAADPQPVPSGAFKAIEGKITPKKATEATPFDLNDEEFTAGANGLVAVAITVTGKGGTLDPGRIRVRQGSEPVKSFEKPNVNGSTDSFALALVKSGTQYEVVVQGQGNTVGEYAGTLALGGDVDGDLKVAANDVAAVEKVVGSVFGQSAYVAAADMDRDGKIAKSDLRRVKDNLGASHTQKIVNPLESALPEGALTLGGVTDKGLNPVGANLVFDLTGTTFATENAADTRLWVNGAQVPEPKLTLEASSIKASGVLVGGRNDLHFESVDAVGRPLYLDRTVWAGASDLNVVLVKPDGTAFTDEASLRLSLVDDAQVAVTATTISGAYTFKNVPGRTVLVKASASGNRTGTIGVLGDAGAATITVLGFEAPSTVDNNDFADGTADGWETGGAPVTIAPHVEDVGPAKSASLKQNKQAGKSREGKDAGVAELAAGIGTPAAKSAAAAAADTIVNNDLVLGTAGEGPQSISRTFGTDENVVGVRVRYRFVTSEVPGGWYGSKYNDYFSVGLRSATGGGAKQESNSMNGLGLAAFDAGGSTAWREAVLPTEKKGDTVQVDLSVANVADNLYPSAVVVDFVEELRERVVPTLSWNTAQGGMDLRFTVESAEPLTKDATIDVNFASGTGHANRLGTAVFTHTVPAGTAPGAGGPIRIAGNLLADDPDGTTHLLAASSPEDTGALADATITYGPNANAAVVPPAMTDVIKDGLRAAGRANASINSTARTPFDQARAMFQNLTNPANTIAVNTVNQLALYAAPGDAVINRFTTVTAGQTQAQIVANAAAVRAAMEAEINAQGPQNVSRHIADPTVRSVVDVGRGAFAGNGGLFRASTEPRLTRFLDEPENNCYHLELLL